MTTPLHAQADEGSCSHITDHRSSYPAKATVLTSDSQVGKLSETSTSTSFDSQVVSSIRATDITCSTVEESNTAGSNQSHCEIAAPPDTLAGPNNIEHAMTMPQLSVSENQQITSQSLEAELKP